MRHIGDSLAKVVATANVYDIEALLVTLCRFPTLKVLSLDVSLDPSQHMAPQDEVVTADQTSIRLLHLRFYPRSLFGREQDIIEDEVDRMPQSHHEIYYSIFLALTRTVPLANTVNLSGQFIPEAALS